MKKYKRMTLVIKKMKRAMMEMMRATGYSAKEYSSEEDESDSEKKLPSASSVIIV
jgi:hypothetical protein